MLKNNLMSFTQIIGDNMKNEDFIFECKNCGRNEMHYFGCFNFNQERESLDCAWCGYKLPVVRDKDNWKVLEDAK